MTKFIVDLTLDGYEDEIEHDAACLEFIREALDFSASSVSVEPYIDPNPDAVVATTNPYLVTHNKMLYVDGSKTAFRCPCGANVFSHMKSDDRGEYYECNGCHTIYTGEKYDNPG